MLSTLRSSLFQYVSRTTQILLKEAIGQQPVTCQKIRLFLCVPYEKIRN